MRDSVTMQDVARQAGVSQTTASHALNGKAEKYRIAATTVQRVREVARSLGYRPNWFARSIRSGEFGQVAVLLSTDRGRSYLPDLLFDSIHDALAEREIQLSVVKLPDEKLTDQGFVPRILRGWCCDGMLVNYTDHIPERMIELIERSGQPAVWLNTKRDRDCVYPDDFGALRRATDRVIALGHRRIAYVDYAYGWADLAAAHYSARDRQAGYERAMSDAGLKPRMLRHSPRSVADPLAFTHRWLAEPDRPTALVSYGPVEATTALFAAAQQGLRVGRDLTVLPVTESAVHVAGILLSSVRTPWAAVGRRGVEMLLERIAKPTESLSAQAVPCALQDGRTVGPVSSDKKR